MFESLWRSGPVGQIIADILLASSIAVSAILLFIAYRKFVAYMGGGKKRKTTVKYATVYDLRPPYAKGEVQFGFELGEETPVKFQIVDKNQNVVKLYKDEVLQKGIYPVYCDTREIKNGEYYYELHTPYQKISKKFFIVN